MISKPIEWFVDKRISDTLGNPGLIEKHWEMLLKCSGISLTRDDVSVLYIYADEYSGNLEEEVISLLDPVDASQIDPSVLNQAIPDDTPQIIIRSSFLSTGILLQTPNLPDSVKTNLTVKFIDSIPLPLLLLDYERQMLLEIAERFWDDDPDCSPKEIRNSFKKLAGLLQLEANPELILHSFASFGVLLLEASVISRDSYCSSYYNKNQKALHVILEKGKDYGIGNSILIREVRDILKIINNDAQYIMLWNAPVIDPDDFSQSGKHLIFARPLLPGLENY